MPVQIFYFSTPLKYIFNVSCLENSLRIHLHLRFDQSWGSRKHRVALQAQETLSPNQKAVYIQKVVCRECQSWSSIRSMWVPDSPSFYTSRCGRENRKCWSHFTIDSYGEKGGSCPRRVIRTSEQKIKVMTGKLGPKLKNFSLTVCRLEL